MQFQVPQFIDTQPKIIGPLTIKQFLIVAAGVIPSLVFFFMLELWLSLPISFVLISISIALSFGKFNGQPLPRIALAAFKYFWEPRFYLWKRTAEPVELPALPRISVPTPKKPSITDLAFKMATTTRPIERRERPGKFFASFRAKEENFEVLRKTEGDRERARRVDYR
ncbi:MAG: PrgI family protein [Patescibacteria group bacterium]